MLMIFPVREARMVAVFVRRLHAAGLRFALGALADLDLALPAAAVSAAAIPAAAAEDNPVCGGRWMTLADALSVLYGRPCGEHDVAIKDDQALAACWVEAGKPNQ